MFDQRRECLESLEASHHPYHFDTAVAILTADLHTGAGSRSIIGGVDWQRTDDRSVRQRHDACGALDGQRCWIQCIGVGPWREREV